MISTNPADFPALLAKAQAWVAGAADKFYARKLAELGGLKAMALKHIYPEIRAELPAMTEDGIGTFLDGFVDMTGADMMKMLEAAIEARKIAKMQAKGLR
ncbi:MAG TPA: hypothetical protein VN647_08975 [Nitrospira sp.]|nr:hypothetical protein [Nitrospira sp.]